MREHHTFRSTTILVTMTPEENQTEFLYQAKKLDLETGGRSMTEIATEVIDASVDPLRSLSIVGRYACAASSFLNLLGHDAARAPYMTK